MTQDENRDGWGVSGTGATTARSAAGRFARHYVEMLAAMLVGMVVFDRLESLLTSTAHGHHAPDDMTVGVLLMAATMTASMAAWMRLRGHGTRLIARMAAGMNAPFLVLVPLWAVGIGDHAAMATAHVSMCLGMLAAMLMRRDAFARPGRRPGVPAAVA
jgi:hypothetical protein